MTAPAHLGAAGVSLWDSIAPNYRLRPDETARLDLACRTADMLDRLERQWSDLGMPMVSTGSMQQEVIHPIIGEMRAQRAALDGALTRLKLPDGEAPASAGDESAKARSAAAARWSGGA
jgi:hypothetical protein